MKKVAFFMSRRHARYKSEEIAPIVIDNISIFPGAKDKVLF